MRILRECRHLRRKIRSPGTLLQFARPRRRCTEMPADDLTRHVQDDIRPLFRCRAPLGIPTAAVEIDEGASQFRVSGHDKAGHQLQGRVVRLARVQ